MRGGKGKSKAIEEGREDEKGQGDIRGERTRRERRFGREKRRKKGEGKRVDMERGYTGI